jgi:hypothetical protein
MFTRLEFARAAGRVAILMLAASSAFAGITPLSGASGQHAPAWYFPFQNFPNPPGPAPESAYFPQPIAVLVTDFHGNAVPGGSVRWELRLRPGSQSYIAGDGQLLGPFAEYPDCDRSNPSAALCITQADSSGIATLPRAYATVAGSYLIDVFNVSYFDKTTIELIADPRVTPWTLRAASGSGQSIVAGTSPTGTFSVQVVRADGTPVANALAAFCAPYGFGTFRNGSFSAGCSTSMTDGSGYAASPSFETLYVYGEGKVLVESFDPDALTLVTTSFDFTTVAANGDPEASYQGMWWGGPSQSGWGVSLVQHADRFFGALFGYDANGQPTWYVMPRGRWNGLPGTANGGTLYTTQGSPFFAYDPAQFTVSDPVHRYNDFGDFVVDDMGFVFQNPDTATFRFDEYQKLPLKSLGLYTPVVRQDFGADQPSPMTGLADMWWGGDTQAGWGVAIHEQPGALFAVWFTYDENGKPTWFMLPPGAWIDSSSYAGPVIRVTASPLGYDGVAYDASRVQLQQVGLYRFTFPDAQNATMEYTAQGHTGTLRLTRQPF